MDLRTEGQNTHFSQGGAECLSVCGSGWLGWFIGRVAQWVLQPNNNSFSLVPLTAVSRALSLCDKRDSGDNCSAFRCHITLHRLLSLSLSFSLSLSLCLSQSLSLSVLLQTLQALPFYGHTIKRAIERLKVSPKCI